MSLDLIKDWQKLSVAELTERVAKLPPEVQKSVVEETYRLTKDQKWFPTVGPQLSAYFSKADLLFYGGQAGGGKSQLLLGLALTAHRRSLLIRQQYNDLDALTEKALEIIGTRRGFNGSNPPSLKTEDGRFIQFSGATMDQWMGHDFDLKCVGSGTPVWMADGSTKAVDLVRAGDMVETIEGPRRVIRAYPVRVKDAVLVSAINPRTRKIIGSQVQSTSHKLLTNSGWASQHEFASLHPSWTCGSTGFCVAEGYSGRFAERTRQASRLLLALASGFLRAAGSALWPPYCLSSPVSFASDERSDGAIVAEGSYCGYLGAWQPSLYFRTPEPREPQPLKEERPSFLTRSVESAERGVGFLSEPQCYHGGCSCGNHQRDERARQYEHPYFDAASALFCLPQRHDAGQPIPNDFEGGGLGEIPRHILRKYRYDHPYTMGKRQAVADLIEYPLIATPIGVTTLYDLEIEDVNSFVTGTGFINKNCFDECAQMPEAVVRFHMGWVRSAIEGQRTRTVLASNPPINSIGDWLVPMFRPWLDLTHPKPAKDGELRWFVKDPDGYDVEVDDERPHQFPGQAKPAIPMSRTFIRAKLSDNPYYANTGYERQLDAMDEPFRSAFRDGDFITFRKDQDYQVLPAAWVYEAQKRWRRNHPRDVRQSAMAIDVGGGGADRVVIAMRYGAWYAPLIAVKGKDAPDGSSQASLIVKHRRDNSAIVVDVGGGYGGDVCSVMKGNGVTVARFNGSESATSRTKDGSGRVFENKRAEAWWRFREALNPDQPGGSIVELPDDMELRSELTAVTFVPDTVKIQIEDKKKVKARLGRSPDKADAVVMAWAPGDTAAKRTRAGGGEEQAPRANLGYSNMKRAGT